MAIANCSMLHPTLSPYRNFEQEGMYARYCRKGLIVRGALVFTWFGGLGLSVTLPYPLSKYL